MNLQWATTALQKLCPRKHPRLFDLGWKGTILRSFFNFGWKLHYWMLQFKQKKQKRFFSPPMLCIFFYINLVWQLNREAMDGFGFCFPLSGRAALQLVPGFLCFSLLIWHSLALIGLFAMWSVRLLVIVLSGEIISDYSTHPKPVILCLVRCSSERLCSMTSTSYRVTTFTSCYSFVSLSKLNLFL